MGGADDGDGKESSVGETCAAEDGILSVSIGVSFLCIPRFD